MFKWSDDIYPYYVIPFQIIIPIIVWITAEIKTRTSGKKDVSEDQAGSTDASSSPKSDNS